MAWLTPFAPTGFHEVWGVVDGVADLTELTTEVRTTLTTELAAAIVSSPESSRFEAGAP